MSPGYDPILDGTAAPYIKSGIREYADGHWEAVLPDGSEVMCDSLDEAMGATVRWHREHPGWPTEGG